MLPDRVSNPGPLTYESGALPIALRGPASGRCTAILESESQVNFLFNALRFNKTQRKLEKSTSKDERNKSVTVKTLKIGTPRLTTVVVLNIKQFDFTMQ